MSYYDKYDYPASSEINADNPYDENYDDYEDEEYDEEYEYEQDRIGYIETPYGDEMDEYIAREKYDIDRKRREEEALIREIESEGESD